VIIDTSVAGIPCKARVQYHPAEYGARECGSGIQLEPDYPAGWQIVEVLDRRGKPARWLEDKMTEQDEQRIVDELGTDNHDY